MVTKLPGEGGELTRASKRATCNSGRYRITLYGILNAQGEFWTPLAFESEEAARQHIRDFWTPRQADMAERCLRDFKIVPVRVNLTGIRP